MNVRTDTYRFWVTWRGQHYQLASLSDHIKHKIDLSQPQRLLLLTKTYRHVMAPLSEIQFKDTAPNT